ncbi:hypothetical protein ACFYRC_34715 [Streptomyces sp. NPDC005279]|uniref:hypothetical protein n=1 Tax=Streptomyces sp. NPDC005279 TaxID=3364712 RepID=UPI00369E7F4B
MSALRNTLRALAVDRPEEVPGQILRRLDTAQARLTLADSAIAILTRLRRTDPHPAARQLTAQRIQWPFKGRREP